ncbi:MAG: class I SAM-dependent methyltransferase [Bacteroidota bacterium]
MYKNMMAGGEFAQRIMKRKLERPKVFDIHRKIVRQAMNHYLGEPKSLYDVGFGAGSIMMVAREEGIESVGGNDLNGHAAKVLQDQGYDAVCAFTQDLCVTKQYDIITCLDYLEHSYTPSADLKFMYELLNDNGILFLKTLYLDSPKHKDMGVSWPLFGQGHFHFFWPDVLKDMFTETGFEILECKSAALITIIAKKPAKS